MRNRGSWIALCTAFAIACGGGGGGGGGGPVGPVTVTGTYEGTHTFTLAGLEVGTCTGRVTVDQQTGDSFSGVLTVDNAGLCMDFGNTAAIAGTVDGSQIRFTFEGTGLEELLDQAFGCQPVGGIDAHVGTIDGATLTATLSREFDCPEQGVSGNASWSIEATRS